MSTPTGTSLEFSKPGSSPSSRARLLEGLGRAIQEKGYGAVTITDVVAHARVSRRTFYQVFETKDDAFFTLVDTTYSQLADDMRSSIATTADWRDQVAQAIGVYVQHVRDHPRVHLSAVRDLPSLGAAALPVLQRNQDSFVELIRGLSDNPRFRDADLAPAPRWLSIMVIGALDQLLVDVLESGHDLDEAHDLAVEAVAALLATTASHRWSDLD